MKRILLLLFTLTSLNTLAQIPADGLVAYFPFNNNANDESGNNNNGIVTGAVLANDRFGNANKAYYFRNNTDIIRIHNSATINQNAVTDNYTVSFWYKTDIENTPSDYYSVIIAKDGTPGYPYKFYHTVKDDSIIVTGNVWDFNSNIGSTTRFAYLKNDAWHQLVFIADKTKDSIFLYIDGGLKSVSQNNTVISGSNDWDLTIANGWTGEKCFIGSIDDIRIYNRVLNDPEIKSHFDEEKLTDVVPEITITGEDTVCAGQASLYSVEISNLSNKYFFRDTTSTGYLTAGYAGNSILNTFSYDLWIKPTRAVSMAGESSVCMGGVSVPLANSNQNWAIRPPNGGLNVAFGVGLTIGTNGIMVAEHTGNILVSRLSYSIAISDWVHVAVVYRPDSIFLYLNGNLVRQRKVPCTSPKYVSDCLAASLYSPEFKGNIDEFRLWDIALTRKNVKAIKDKKLVNQVPGLRYYVGFDNGKFERALGNLGSEQMTIGGTLSVTKHLKSGPPELSQYSGPDINFLTLFDLDQLKYLWSTGETSQMITFYPDNGLNYLSVIAYNGRFTTTDTIKIFGKSCTITPADGLVAYYPFSGNANDESVYKNHGIVEGAILTTDKDDIENRAYYFDGINDLIKLTGGLRITNTFTISFLAYSENASGYSNIIGDGSSDAGGSDFLINFRGNDIGIRADKDASLDYEDSSPEGLQNLNLVNNWVHVIWTMSPTTSKIYVNGAEKITLNEPGSNEGYHDPFSYIGARNVWSTPDNFFKGKLDEIKIYNRVLSFDEIKALSNSYGLISGTDDFLYEMIRIYPNPVSNILYVEGITENVRFTIINYQGRIIQHKLLKGNRVDLSSLKEGIYLIKFETGSGNLTRKFLKQ